MSLPLDSESLGALANVVGPVVLAYVARTISQAAKQLEVSNALGKGVEERQAKLEKDLHVAWERIRVLEKLYAPQAPPRPFVPPEEKE
jgi:hypothetical protein